MVGKETIRKVDPELASKIVGTVPMPNAFLFFAEIGQYTGQHAISLADFLEKLKTVPLRSMEFHFKRGDFQKWIKDTLGDKELADRISRFNKNVQGESLREVLYEIVEKRLNQLRAAAPAKK